MVGGDPKVLADCGNSLMTTSIDLDEGRTPMAARTTMPAAVLGELSGGSGIMGAYAAVQVAVVKAAQNLQSTMSEDGYHLQRGAANIDTVMNSCETAPPPTTGPGPQPV